MHASSIKSGTMIGVGDVVEASHQSLVHVPGTRYQVPGTRYILNTGPGLVSLPALTRSILTTSMTWTCTEFRHTLVKKKAQ